MTTAPNIVRLRPAWHLRASELRAIAANILGDASELTVMARCLADSDELAGDADEYDDEWADSKSAREAAAVLLGAAQRVDDLEAEHAAAIGLRWTRRCASAVLGTLHDDALEAKVAEVIGRFGWGIHQAAFWATG